MQTLSLAQILVLVGYFLFIYLYKFLVSGNAVSEKASALLTQMIPAVNLIFGLVLGAFHIMNFDMTVAVLGSLATGGAAGLVKMPSQINEAMKLPAPSNESESTEQPV